MTPSGFPRSPGLLVGLSTCPAELEERFNEWYDEEHVSVRMELSGFMTARRYRELGRDVPASGWLAYYDLTSSDVLDEPDYLGLRANLSQSEKEVLSGILRMERRVYRRLELETDTREPSRSVHDPDVCGAVLVCEWWTPWPAQIGELNAWYDEEHIPSLLGVPGWLRARRFETITLDGPRFLVMHDLASADVLEEEAVRRAFGSPRRSRLAEKRDQYERRVFRLWRKVR